MERVQPNHSNYVARRRIPLNIAARRRLSPPTATSVVIRNCVYPIVSFSTYECIHGNREATEPLEESAISSA